MGSRLVTRDDGITVDLDKQEAAQADITSKGKKALLVSADGTPISDANKLPVEATLEVGDIEIGAVEIKDHDSDARVDVKSDGTNNALVITQNSQPLPTGASTSALQTTGNNFLNAIAGLVPSAYDYINITYTGLNPTTVVYKTGGSGGTTVATLTLTYDGNNNVLTVTKT